MTVKSGMLTASNRPSRNRLASKGPKEREKASPSMDTPQPSHVSPISLAVWGERSRIGAQGGRVRRAPYRSTRQCHSSESHCQFFVTISHLSVLSLGRLGIGGRAGELKLPTYLPTTNEACMDGVSRGGGWRAGRDGSRREAALSKEVVRGRLSGCSQLLLVLSISNITSSITLRGRKDAGRRRTREQ